MNRLSFFMVLSTVLLLTVFIVTAAVKPPRQLNLVAGNAPIEQYDMKARYFVGGVTDVPGNVVFRFNRECTSQKTDLGKWYQLWKRDPKLICNDKPFWSKKKGYGIKPRV
jgi:hypothetical protein